jgi:hypothetical protein
MYTILNKNSSFPTAQRKWNTVFDINSNEWKQIYILPFKATAWKIFCRDDGTKGVCKLDDLSPYGYNFSICRKELITPLYCKKFTQNPNLFENWSKVRKIP